MLRITIQEEATKVTLKLEGRIVGPWATEFDRTWRSLNLSANGKNKKLFVNLCGVSYVDREGRGVLADIYRRTHARFETDTPLMEHFVQEAESSSENANEKGATK